MQAVSGGCGASDVCAVYFVFAAAEAVAAVAVAAEAVAAEAVAVAAVAVAVAADPVDKWATHIPFSLTGQDCMLDYTSAALYNRTNREIGTPCRITPVFVQAAVQ